jgi:hypothetical protein
MNEGYKRWNPQSCFFLNTYENVSNEWWKRMKFDILCHMHKSKCQRKFNPKMKIKGVAFLKTKKKQWEKLMNMAKLVYNIDWR